MAVEVYSSGPLRHQHTEEVLRALFDPKIFGERTISDSVAQTIASWWHSPGRPNTTLLSSRGVVMSDTEIDDFADPEEYDNCEDFERKCLNALQHYIQTKKREYLSKNRMLCPFCFELAVKDFNKNPETRKQAAWQSDRQYVDCEQCYEPLIRWWSNLNGWSSWDQNYSS